MILYMSVAPIISLLDAFSSGASMEMPIIWKRGDGALHLVSGNTRLMIMRAQGIRPKVLIASFEKGTESSTPPAPLR